MAIDPTVGGPTANSYLSVEAADAYFADRLFATAWTGALKAAALITATRRLEDLAWAGVRTTTTQALAWPRRDVYDEDLGQLLDERTIPVEIQHATCEFALYMLTQTSDPSATDPLAKFSAIELPGGLSLTLRDGVSSNDALPPIVARKVAKYRAGSGLTYLERA